MLKDKTFDCVKMKHDIQQDILKEMAGFSKEKKRRRTEEAILNDPILCRIWKNARRIHTTQSHLF